MNFSFRRFWHIFVARNWEFLRDKANLGWSFAFPFLMLIGFYFIFGNANNQAAVKVGIFGPQSTVYQQRVAALPQVEAVLQSDLESARDKIAHHKLDLLLDTNQNPPEYWVSETSPKGYLAERLAIDVLSQGERPPVAAHYTRQTLTGTEIPYVEWFFPGLLGMNIMFMAVWGVGYVVVRYRKNGVLKRLATTPLTAFEFLSAQLASRLFLILMSCVILFGGSILMFGFEVRGSWLAVILLTSLGSSALIAMGTLVAARTESEELAGGLLNLMTWPMMLLSEVWFSLEGAPDWVQQVALALPLTHLIRGLRAVMNDGAGLGQVSMHLSVMALMTVIFLGLGAGFFRWQRVS